MRAMLLVWGMLHLPVLWWALYPGRGTRRAAVIWSAVLVGFFPALVLYGRMSCTSLECTAEPYSWIWAFIAVFLIVECVILLVMYLVGWAIRYVFADWSW